MTRQDILEKLKQIAVTIDRTLENGIADVGEGTRVLEDLGFSSFQMLFLAVMLEETFSIRIADLRQMKIVTVGDVVDLIITHQAQD